MGHQTPIPDPALSAGERNSERRDFGLVMPTACVLRNPRAIGASAEKSSARGGAVKKRRSAPIPAMVLTRKHWENLGYRFGVVEQFVRMKIGGFRRDLFGFADACLFHPEKPGVVFLQITVGDRHADHFRELLGSARAYELVCCGCRVGLHTWSKDVNGKKYDRFKWFTRDMFENLPIGAFCKLRLKPKRPARKVKNQEPNPDELFT